MKINAESLMEDRRLKTRRPKDNDGNLKLVLYAILITIIIIAIIMFILIKIAPVDNSLKVFIDGEQISADTSLFIFSEDKIYVNIKEISSKIGYEAHSGEYKIEAEDRTKVFVENKDETASMQLNSNIINKIEPNSNNDYKSYKMSDVAREVNGEIYIISDGFEMACNSKLIYNNNRIDIQTLNYLYEICKNGIQKAGYIELSDNFENKKAIRYNRLVLKNSDNRYGVFDLNLNEIISTRYSNIQFDESTQEFTITNQSGQMGVDKINGDTKISVKYDSIKNINKNNEIYLVESNGKYGVINGDEAIIIHMEYDDIGVDIEPYVKGTKNTETSDIITKENDIEKKYIFFDKLIPVQQNGKYGFFDINGNIITDIKYIGIGCYARNVIDDRGRIVEQSTKTTNNVLSIDSYEAIVVEGENGYGIIDINGKERVETSATDIYYVLDAGETIYYMIYGGKTYNLETDVFDGLGMKKIS